MDSIIQHRRLERFFSFASAFLAGIFLLIPSVAYAQGADQTPSGAALATVELLKNEIARDEEIISVNMNISRLRQTREKLKEDLPRKEKTLAAIKNVKNTAIESAVQTMETTYNAEKQIADDIRINDAVQIRTMRTIRDNLEKKKQALADIETSVKTKSY